MFNSATFTALIATAIITASVTTAAPSSSDALAAVFRRHDAAPKCGYSGPFLTFDPPALTLDDKDFHSKFNVVLNQAPASDVSVFLNADGLKFDNNEVYFTKDNWNKPQTIHVVPSHEYDDHSAGSAKIEIVADVDAVCDKYHMCEQKYEVTRTVYPGGHCSTGGDPHIVSLDGIKYSFQGKGIYTLFDSDYMKVEAYHYPCKVADSIPEATCVGAVGIHHANSSGIVSIVGKDYDKYNGNNQFKTAKNIQFEKVSDDVTSIAYKQSGNTYEFDFDEGSNVQVVLGEFNGFYYLSVNALIAPGYHDLCHGLCNKLGNTDKHLYGQDGKGYPCLSGNCGNGGDLGGTTKDSDDFSKSWHIADVDSLFHGIHKGPKNHPLHRDEDDEACKGYKPQAGKSHTAYRTSCPAKTTTTTTPPPPTTTSSTAAVSSSTTTSPQPTYTKPTPTTTTCDVPPYTPTSYTYTNPTPVTTSTTQAAPSTTPSSSAYTSSSSSSPSSSSSQSAPSTSSTTSAYTSSSSAYTSSSQSAPSSSSSAYTSSSQSAPSTSSSSSAYTPSSSSSSSQAAPSTTTTPAYTPSQSDIDKATAHCQDVLSHAGCDSICPVTKDNYLHACIQDALLTNSHAFTDSHKEAYQAHCAAKVNKMAESYNATAQAQAQDVAYQAGFGNNTCPNNCSANGVCSAYGCTCQAPYTGHDCSIDQSQAANAAPAPGYTPALVNYAAQPVNASMPAAPGAGNYGYAPLKVSTGVAAPSTSAGYVPKTAYNGTNALMYNAAVKMSSGSSSSFLAMLAGVAAMLLL